MQVRVDKRQRPLKTKGRWIRADQKRIGVEVLLEIGEDLQYFSQTVLVAATKNSEAAGVQRSGSSGVRQLMVPNLGHLIFEANHRRYP
ncbi:hypothetical protein SAMN06265222_11830 [Neorhodopirellula lusitana]|uniref:Transposase n=1 Tax=Neorhodopirellula lusitana TaxID=445327 RepID=A0ABY1QMB6_9BACT|nr:hypothetical protein [Neorhodopirellula lusitana]SMP74770.1 hypothetical protein SAMN06265222_11830 [Neorhodopirellula lusitana]